MRKHISILTMIVMTILMIVPMTAFAAEHDSTEDRSSDTATIYIGKVLTVNQNNKFPSVNDFTFQLEAVRAWDNANVKSNLSGADIGAEEMPMPAAVTTAHQKVTPTGTTAAVTAGDFMGAANTSVADTAVEKYRATPVRIKFTKAGYYMYSVSETGSSPENIPGVTYDESSYYIVVYVCNRTDSQGNTIPGVYVHDITSYRNTADTDVQPDLSDIQNVTDNNGTAAKDNIYTNFEKTGKSTPEHPDQLEAYRFWNDQTTHDVVITKNVTGNLGDITKEFEMTVTLTGLEKNKTYTTDVAAEFKTEQNTTSQGADIVSASVGSVNSAGKTFTADASGNATFLIKLADNEVLVLNALPASSNYKVEEHATDHVGSYKVTSTSNSAVIASAQGANTGDRTAITTAVETVDAVSNVTGRTNSESNDGTVTIAFTNHRDLAVITGLPYYGDFVYVLAALMIVFIGAFAVYRHRTRSEDI